MVSIETQPTHTTTTGITPQTLIANAGSAVTYLTDNQHLSSTMTDSPKVARHALMKFTAQDHHISHTR